MFFDQFSLNSSGGKSVEDNSCVSRVDVYCPDTDSWSAGPDMIRAVYGHSCASLQTNKIFVIGGKSQNKVGFLVVVKCIIVKRLNLKQKKKENKPIKKNFVIGQTKSY